MLQGWVNLSRDPAGWDVNAEDETPTMLAGHKENPRNQPQLRETEEDLKLVWGWTKAEAKAKLSICKEDPDRPLPELESWRMPAPSSNPNIDGEEGNDDAPSNAHASEVSALATCRVSTKTSSFSCVASVLARHWADAVPCGLGYRHLQGVLSGGKHCMQYFPLLLSLRLGILFSFLTCAGSGEAAKPSSRGVPEGGDTGFRDNWC